MKLVLILSMLASLNSLAAELEIFSDSYNDGDAYGEPYFRVNAKEGKASLNMTVAKCRFPGPIGCSPSNIFYKTEELNVPGMKFNQEKEEIVITSDDTEVVCATTYLKRGRFGRMVRIINRTGDCIISSETRYEDVQRGNRTYRTKVYRLYLTY